MKRHKEATAQVRAAPATVFARLDDQTRLLPSLADGYSQWCVDQMLADAAGAFGRLDAAAAAKAERPAA